MRLSIDENMEPPASTPASTSAASAATATTTETSSSTTTNNNNNKLMLQKLNHFLSRCFSNDDAAAGSATNPIDKNNKSSNNNSNNNSSSGQESCSGPQTRYRGRAEKLKSRWMNMVNSAGAPAANPLSLPAPPSVRQVAKPVFPQGFEPQFELITDNQYLVVGGRGKKADSRMTCECVFTAEMAMEGRLGCTSATECFNRIVYVECGSRCAAGDYCANKRFQRHEYACLELFDAGAKGLGVRSLSPLAPGDFLLEYVGEVIDFDHFRSRLRRYSKAGRKHWFFMALSSEQYVDATRKGNLSRYMNHSCDPNAEIQKWTVNGQVRIGFFARKNIAVGEEVTLDYQFETYGAKSQKCLCGSTSCRGYIGKLVLPVDELNDGSSSSGNNNASDRKTAELAEKIEQLASADNKSYLRSSAGLLDLCRLMVRAESRDHRSTLVRLLLGQLAAAETGNNNNGSSSSSSSSASMSAGGQAKSQLSADSLTATFISLHGLAVLWSWLVEEERPKQPTQTSLLSPSTDQPRLPPPCSSSSSSDCDNDSGKSSLTLLILELLDAIPIPNRNVLEDSQILSVVDRLAQLSEESDSDASSSTTTTTRVKSTKTIARSLVNKWADLKQVFRIPRIVVVSSSSSPSSHQQRLTADNGRSNNSKPSPESPVAKTALAGSVGSDSSASSSSWSSQRNQYHHHHHNSNNTYHYYAHTGPQIHRAHIQPRTDGAMSKELRRKLFEQAMIEEEKQRMQKLEEQEQEQQRRCVELAISAAAEQRPLMDVSSSSSSSSSNDSEEDAQAAIISDLLADCGLDLETVFGEISQILAEPSLFNLESALTGDPDCLTRLLSTFPSLTKLISVLSGNRDLVESSTGKTSAGDALSSSSSGSETMPTGWASAIDASSGETYYYNLATGQTQWDPPNGDASKKTGAGSSSSSSSSSSGSSKKRRSSSQASSKPSPSKLRRKSDVHARFCEIHLVVDDCSPFSDEPQTDSRHTPADLTTKSNTPGSDSVKSSSESSSGDQAFKSELGAYIGKLLRRHCSREEEEVEKVEEGGDNDEMNRMWSLTRHEFESVSRKLTETIYSKEVERRRVKSGASQGLKVTGSLQAKVRGFIDSYLERMKRKQLNSSKSRRG